VKWSTDNTVATATVVVAVLAVFIAWDQGRTMREHNKMSVRPLLVIEEHTIPGSDRGIFIRNVGPGPARMGHVGLFFDRRRIEYEPGRAWSTLRDTLAKYVPQHFAYPAIVTEHPPGSVLQAGETAKALVIPAAEGDSMSVVGSLIEHIGIKLWYKSLYDETFLAVAGNIIVAESDLQYIEVPADVTRPEGQ